MQWWTVLKAITCVQLSTMRWTGSVCKLSQLRQRMTVEVMVVRRLLHMSMNRNEESRRGLNPVSEYNGAIQGFMEMHWVTGYTCKSNCQ